MKRALSLLLSLGCAASLLAQSGGTLTLPSGGGGATLPTTSSILEGDGAGGAQATTAAHVNSLINSTVAPVFANVASKPSSAAGYSITNGATIDLWGAKSLPAGAVVGTTDAQTLSGKHYSAVAVGSIAAGAALSSPTLLTVAGTDAMGIISITPSATGGTSGVTCTVTFGATYGSAPKVALLPFNSASVTNQSGAKALLVGTVTATGFDVNAGSTGLTTSTNIQLVYIVSGP